jgi:hypothetical protein
MNLTSPRQLLLSAQFVLQCLPMSPLVWAQLPQLLLLQQLCLRAQLQQMHRLTCLQLLLSCLICQQQLTVLL